MNENFKDTLSKLNNAFKLSQVNGCFQKDLCKEILQELVVEKLNSKPSAEQQRKDLIPLLTDAVFLLKGDCCSYQDRDEALSKLNAALAELKSISS